MSLEKKELLLKALKIGTVCLLVGGLFGLGAAKVILHMGAGYSDLDKLREHRPKLFTRVYDRKGKLLDIFSSEKRIVLDYNDIPKDFVNALLAVEDEDFFHHIGVSPFGILSAVKDNLLTGRLRGASTLTQQLVKNITKDKRQSYSRKLKEQFLAVQLEVMFTKEEIFAMYANEIELGNSQFGIEAAARFYFGKSVGSLSLVECATLAGLPQAPSLFNPYRRPEECRRRRNLVLDRMGEEGYLTRERVEAAKKEPLQVISHKRNDEAPIAKHFVDKIRAYLFENYGEERVRSSGWDVYTSLDLDYQVVAENALRKGLKEVDKRQGYRSWDCPNVYLGVEGEARKDPSLLEAFFDPSWHTELQEGINIRGVIMEVGQDQARVRIQDQYFQVDGEAVRWTGYRKDLSKILKVGDTPLFLVEAPAEKADEGAADEEPNDAQETVAQVEKEEKPRFRLTLDQVPVIEGAFLAVDQSSGDILAMVGGYDYNRSKFNRAEQARRQVGSAFKPVVFGAALEQGYTLSDILFDEPTMFIDPTQFELDEGGVLKLRKQSPAVERARRRGVLPTPEPYAPENFYKDYTGAITLRRALAASKNIVAVKLLDSIGYDHAIDYAHRLGLGAERLRPYPSMALGSLEMTLQEVVYAYSPFSMNGVRFEPRFISRILDQKGRLIEANNPHGEQVISPENAYLMTSALTSVVESDNGTAKRARVLNIPVAGKTGTTDDYTDAWFIGYNPKILAGVWVGHDQKAHFNDKAVGANTALPIWVDFFQDIKKDLGYTKFEVPEGLTKLPVDMFTGKRITVDCDCSDFDQIVEYYIQGTEPNEICAREEKKRAELPWYLQKRVYEFDETKGEVRPSMVVIDYASQKRANELIVKLQEEAARK